MWKCINSTLISKPQVLSIPFEVLNQQTRNAFILKRVYQPLLHGKGHSRKKLRNKHYIYELIKNTSFDRLDNVEVILTSLVEGLGNVGDRISVKPNYAYNNLLLPGLAVYASPENQEKYKSLSDKDDGYKFSTPSAAYTVKTLSRILLSVVMNKDMPWTIKPWHIKASFRKCGYFVPEDAIELPEKPITGPNMDIQNKEFAVTVTINKKEKVNVRCRVHHWSTDIVDRIPYTPEFWKTPVEPIISEQKTILESLPQKRELKNYS